MADLPDEREKGRNVSRRYLVDILFAIRLGIMKTAVQNAIEVT